MSFGDRVSFAAAMIKKRCNGQNTNCPYCRSTDTRTLERKMWLLELRECQQCWLRFRYPKDDLVENFDYYQQQYQQTTFSGLPSEAELKQHLANNFRDVRDLRDYIALVQRFSAGKKLLDYGASWGYCTWQFQQAGYDAMGFEISHPRTDYGQKMLGIAMVNSTADLPSHSFDIVYASHVLEHIPDPAVPLREFRRLLAPGGKVFIFVPNGAGEAARRLGVKWPPLINQRHVMAYTPRFFATSLGREGFAVEIASSPYDSPPRPYEGAGAPFDGEELLVIGTA